MTHHEIFLEVKRALHPLGRGPDSLPAPGAVDLVQSARSQMANVNIEDEQDDT